MARSLFRSWRSVAAVRELFGSGTLLGVEILPLVKNGGWYEPNGMMLLAPGVLAVLVVLGGLLILFGFYPRLLLDPIQVGVNEFLVRLGG